jgi:hypothetical protein
MTIIQVKKEIMLEAISPYWKFSEIYNPEKYHESLREFYEPCTENPIYFGIENIDMYGKFPINIDHYSSKKGKLITINESGEGFDFEEVQEKFIEKDKYFHNQGEGFKIYNLPYFFISFEKNGTQINFLRLF